MSDKKIIDIDKEYVELLHEMEQDCVKVLARKMFITEREAHNILDKSYKNVLTNMKKGFRVFASKQEFGKHLEKLCYERAKLFLNARLKINDITKNDFSFDVVKAFHKLDAKDKVFIVVGKIFGGFFKRVHEEIATRLVLLYPVNSANVSKKTLQKAVENWKRKIAKLEIKERF